MFKHYAYQNKPLSYEKAYELALYTIKGCKGDNLAAIQSLALLCALHNKATYSHPDAYMQIAGLVAGIMDADIHTSEFGFLNPNVPYVVDNSGMGGDDIVTANISTLASFICASLGLYMCKHGSPANSDAGRHGSSDFVALCGIPVGLSNTDICKSVEENHWGYIEACDTRFKRIHTQTHEFAQLSHMNDLLGPLTAPISPTIARYKVIGINSLLSPRIVAQTCQLLNNKGITKLEKALFVQGHLDNNQHVDELVLTKHGTSVAELTRNNELIEYVLYPKDFGINSIDQQFLSPPGGMSKGEYSKAIMERSHVGPIDSIIAANASLIFYCVEDLPFKTGYDLCLNQIKSDKVTSFVSQLKNF